VTTQNAERVYSSKIIKASGLLADTKTLFVHWDESKTDEENLREARRTNIFGKASRSRVEDILTIFRQRYIPENGSGRVLRRLVRSDLPTEVVDRVMYYYAALADPLIYDFVVEYLYDLYQRGRQVVAQEDALNFLDQATAHGRINPPWRSGETRLRVAQGLLSTLRDFRVLQAAKGSPRKTFAPVHLPIEAFLYIAFDIQREVASGERLLRHSHWRLFLLNVEAIERLFIEAHQLGYLRYEAAGSIVRIEFADKDLAALVKTIVERWQMWNR
jgi:hypothetical protein